MSTVLPKLYLNSTNVIKQNFFIKEKHPGAHYEQKWLAFNRKANLKEIERLPKLKLKQKVLFLYPDDGVCEGESGEGGIKTIPKDYFI